MHKEALQEWGAFFVGIRSQVEEITLIICNTQLSIHNAQISNGDNLNLKIDIRRVPDFVCRLCEDRKEKRVMISNFVKEESSAGTKIVYR